jgi:hypothetical protein
VQLTFHDMAHTSVSQPALSLQASLSSDKGLLRVLASAASQSGMFTPKSKGFCQYRQ